MKKLSFLGAVCAAVFACSAACAQVTDTTRTERDTLVTPDTTLRPDDRAPLDTAKGTLDNGRNNGIGTDTIAVPPPPPSPSPDMGTGTNGDDNGMDGGTDRTGTDGTSTDPNRIGNGTADNNTGLRNGNPGNTPVLPPKR